MNTTDREAFDYERIEGTARYRDALSEFYFCGGCHGGRCRPTEDGDEYVCADGCGRTYTVQTDDNGVLES